MIKSALEQAFKQAFDDKPVYHPTFTKGDTVTLKNTEITYTVVSCYEVKMDRDKTPEEWADLITSNNNIAHWPTALLTK